METINNNDEIEIDLREIFFLLLEKLWIILLAAVCGAAALFVYTKTVMRPIYESQSMISILSKSTSLTSLADVQLGTQLTNDYMVLIKSRPVLEKVIENLELEDTEYKELNGNITVDNPDNTRILVITVRDYDPQTAQAIVNELTDISIERVADVMATDPPRVVDYGHVAEKPSSPSVVKNTIAGGLALAVLACVVIVVVYLMNDSIRTSDDVEKYLGLNTLGLIPLEESVSKKRTRGHDKDAKRLKKRKKKTA